MSNAVGITVIVSNIALIGVFAFAAYRLTKTAERLEERLSEAQTEATTRIRRVIKDLL